MTTLAYLECPTGLAGDMCLGSLVHAGVPLEYLAETLSLLGIAQEYNLWTELVQRNGQQAAKVHVELLNTPPPDQESHPIPEDPFDPNNSGPTHSHGSPTHLPSIVHSDSDVSSATQPHNHSHSHAPTLTATLRHEGRHLPEIEKLIQSAQLPDRVTQWSLKVFRQLAAAEAAVHGIPPEQVHFHEVGATDAIVDIVGACLGFDWLGIEQLYCSALPVGGGTVRAAHGLLPVPAPAVLKLFEMRQVPIYSNGIHRELVTPTGAAIVTALATRFGPPPAMQLQRVGLGAGSRDLPIPNIVRLWLGTEASGLDSTPRSRDHVAERPSTATNLLPSPVSGPSHAAVSPALSATPAAPCLEPITVLETQIDDLNPQAIGYVFETLFAAGALDVFTQAIGMKKSRPGILLTVICHPQQADICEAAIFRETSTLGVRRFQQQRTTLPRQFQTVETSYGRVRIKVTQRGTSETITDGQPEYEDCAQLARKSQVPWQAIYRLALYAWHSQVQQESKR